MTPWQRAAAGLGGALLLGTPLLANATAGCQLVLSEHRSGHLLWQAPMHGPKPGLQLRFVHSVLGTPVVDHYEFRPAAQAGAPWRAHLVAEDFSGEGYGLPHVAGQGEQLLRHDGGWRLRLQREVHPLVVRPLPAQHMQLRLADGQTHALAGFSSQAIEISLRGCPPPSAGASDPAHPSAPTARPPR